MANEKVQFFTGSLHKLLNPEADDYIAVNPGNVYFALDQVSGDGEDENNNSTFLEEENAEVGSIYFDTLNNTRVAMVSRALTDKNGEEISSKYVTSISLGEDGKSINYNKGDGALENFVLPGFSPDQFNLTEKIVNSNIWANIYGSFILSEDKEIDFTKAYFIKNDEGIYEFIKDPKGNPTTNEYYELESLSSSISEFINNYFNQDVNYGTVLGHGIDFTKDGNYKVSVCENGILLTDKDKNNKIEINDNLITFTNSDSILECSSKDGFPVLKFKNENNTVNASINGATGTFQGKDANLDKEVQIGNFKWTTTVQGGLRLLPT